MAAKKKATKPQPEAPKKESLSVTDFADYLAFACGVCERGAAVEKYQRVVFKDGVLQAYNGLLHYQAPSVFEKQEFFALAEEKLAQALRACGGEGMSASLTDAQVKLQQGPFSVRIRKLPAEQLFFDRIRLPAEAASQKAPDLQAALRRVRDFVSTDASKPWSCSVLIRDGFAYATNNLSLVRTPLQLAKGISACIPLAAVNFLCDLPELGYYHFDDSGRLVVSYKRSLLRTLQHRSEWPEVSRFFDEMPKVLPLVPAELRRAAEVVEKFADRFISLSDKNLGSATAAMEAKYEVQTSGAKGEYSSRLLSLLLSHATHADFSTYPKPLFFRGEQIEGVAVGKA